MNKNRLEAFSDGVIAIIITITVLELKVPHGADFDALQPLLPRFLAYVLSFVYVGIYWNNHHHLLHAVHRVTGPTLWANLALLFWLSLTPFTTDWVGENHAAPLPVAIYGAVLLACGTSYYVLQCMLLRDNPKDSALARAIGQADLKGKSSLVIYAVAIPLAYVHVAIALAAYVLVALIWLVPDSRIERQFKE